ncbi:hypothetical protein M405DRAFT_868645 [Rhizopogon salebrosus TDB-379]|nr:hypothetical protein M405DRAFT_868645 [Rhizopogon salebrosus TDB-379]
MGVHCGTPKCESDPSTGRMDYFGPMVIRAARISGNAAGGQIMCSAAVVREINAKIFETGPDTEYSEFQPTQAIEVIRQMQIAVVHAGEIKLKGLELPEVVSLVYPAAPLGRQNLDASGSSSALVKSEKTLSDEDVVEPSIIYGDPSVLFPPMNDKTSDLEIMMQLDSLSLRLENAAKSLTLRSLADQSSAIMTALEDKEGIDEQTLPTSLYTFKPVHITHAHSCYAYYQPVESYTSSALTTQSETDAPSNDTLHHFHPSGRFPSSTQYISPYPSSHGRAPPQRIPLPSRGNDDNSGVSLTQPRFLQWARKNPFSNTRNSRIDESIELQERHTEIVDAPFNKGAERYVSRAMVEMKREKEEKTAREAKEAKKRKAREARNAKNMKNPPESSSRPSQSNFYPQLGQKAQGQPPPALHSSAGLSTSSTPATVAASPVTTCWVRFWSAACCIPPQNANDHH